MATVVFQDMKKNLIEPSIDTINVYFKACATELGGIKKIDSEKSNNEEKKAEIPMDNLLYVIDKAVIELSNKCKNLECKNFIKEEVILTLWEKNCDSYTIKCPFCEITYIPTLNIKISAERDESCYFLFPPMLKKEINNLINNETSKVFFHVYLFKILGFLL